VLAGGLFIFMKKFDWYIEIYEHANCEWVEYLKSNKLYAESPLEKAFLGYWLLEFGSGNYINNGNCLELFAPNWKQKINQGYETINKIVYQKNVWKYKIDFTFSCEYPLMNKTFAAFDIFVELDGHKFHEKTKQQVNYRNQRDAFLNKQGLVYHLSGNKLYSNIDKTIESLICYINEIAEKKFEEGARFFEIQKNNA